ncbi:MAG: response regulator [Lachnospiraceae bacterium]|nr:response regulator [Lachnospiraceae bacterium]
MDNNYLKNDKSNLMKIAISVVAISAVVLIMLFTITGNQSVEQCKNRLRDETKMSSKRFESLISVDNRNLKMIATAFGGIVSANNTIDVELLDKIEVASTFSEIFLVYNNGDIVGVNKNVEKYAGIEREVFNRVEGITFMFDEEQQYYELLEFVPLFEGKIALVGVGNRGYFASTFDMEGASVSSEISVVDAVTGTVLLSFNNKGVVDTRVRNDVYAELSSYTQLEHETDDITAEPVMDIKNNMVNKIAGDVCYKNSDGQSEYVSYAPIADTGWNLMMTMSQHVVLEQKSEYRQRFVVLVLSLLAIYAVILAISILLFRKNAKENEKIMMQYRVAELANEAKTNFMSNMSHDIRTPLNAIVGLADICEMNADNPARVKECIEKQRAASEHLLTLINDVLEMSRIESGKVTFDNKTFHIGDQIHGIISMLQKKMEEKNIKCSVSVTNLQHENLIGDVQRINRVLLNVIGNAVKYTGCDGRIIVTINEIYDGIRNHTNIEYTISDNGIGMSQEFLKRIYVPFERMKDSTISQIEGAGLGMTIAHDLVSKMEGSIDVKSVEGKGTTVKIVIPLECEEESTELTEVEAKYKNKTVIVVDDDPALVEWMHRLVLSIGMKCVATTNAFEALDSVKLLIDNNSEDIALVILGWVMPRMDGLELSYHMRKYVGNDVPIVLQTFKEVGDKDGDIRAAGINLVMTEPLFRKDLLKLFEDLSSEESSSIIQLPDFSGRRILLVEDHRINAEIVSEYLEYTGISVEVVYDGLEAVERMYSISDGYYDLILMDIRMPKMNGYDATRKIRAMGREYTDNIPIIALSANAFAEDRKLSRQVGMNGHLAKPVNYDDIYNELRKWFKD